MSTLKHLVSEKLNVPVRQQRLLFKGKALAGNGERRWPGSPARNRGRVSGPSYGWGMGHLTLEVVADPSSTRCHSNP